ncbi:MAG TPA: class I SAM-dependent methyltransferase [Casimicrobiaceae bacterium]|nr:class I SAM-dependent methyltransferase [Casimicrobiaceae bacterium]
MADFDKARETWNTRYARDDYLFGEAPNAFLRRQAHWLKPGGSVLCVADGEGRNSVWLAEQGFDVTAFDFAPNALAKATRLARQRNVIVDHRPGDMDTWPWSARQYDALVAVFIQFMAPRRREAAFAGMMSAVAPGGIFVLEGYRPEQVDYRTGGPPDRENMYTREWLSSTFTGWELLVLDDYDAAIGEGSAHLGMSALIDLVARKP